jgi:hypothetical protein
MEPYRSYFPNAGVLLPNTIRLSERILCLPNGELVGEAEIAAISEIIRIAIEDAAGTSRTEERAAVAV